ncbi:MAG: hypothetical protein ACRDPA_26195, partial [Solirubrobacteraceae bacterium]
EDLWQALDALLASQHHRAAASDTYQEWAKGEGPDQGDRLHAKNVPTNALLHIDLFGEGYFKDAINIGDTLRKSTTGVQGSPVPNLIYKHFSNKDAKLPIADHIADLVTSENGPLVIPGILEEIARIIAPGGTIILYNPGSMVPYHDKMVKLTGGKLTRETHDDKVQSTIVVPY